MLTGVTAFFSGKDKGVRIVEVPSNEQSSILEVARGAGRYPRIRFILVADNVDMPLRGGMAADLMAGLTGGSGASGWPDNILLYVGVTPTSTLSFDPVVSRFGEIITTGDLSEQDFEATLTEVSGSPVSPDQVSAAVRWAEARGGPSVRNAVMYARISGDHK